MVTELDLDLGGGRRLYAYDTGADPGRLAVFWHHGTPNIGAPPEPLFAAADRLGVRWVSYDRPGYGGSTPVRGRGMAAAAGDVAAVADALGIDRFAVMGHSSGGPHALACGALLPDRTTGVVSVSGLAPFGAERLDWFAGMAPSGEAALRAAVDGVAARERHEGEGEPGFIEADWAALKGDWSWLLSVVGPAMESNAGGPVDDDVANVGPWGFDPATVTAPVLLVHGRRDRMVPSSHSEWLARTCPMAELRLFPDDGHISVLHAAEAALEWLVKA